MGSVRCIFSLFFHRLFAQDSSNQSSHLHINLRAAAVEEQEEESKSDRRKEEEEEDEEEEK